MTGQETLRAIRDLIDLEDAENGEQPPAEDLNAIITEIYQMCEQALDEARQKQRCPKCGRQTPHLVKSSGICKPCHMNQRRYNLQSSHKLEHPDLEERMDRIVRKAQQTNAGGGCTTVQLERSVSIHSGPIRGRKF